MGEPRNHPKLEQLVLKTSGFCDPPFSATPKLGVHDNNNNNNIVDN